MELAGGLTLEGSPKFYRVTRLTHTQWEHAVKDLLKLSALPGLSSGFSPDPPDGKFSNNERALYVSNGLRGDYQRTAETLAENVTRDSAALARVGNVADAASFISTLGKAAFRRPLASDEQQRYMKLFAAGPSFFTSGNDKVDGARAVIEALLQSPHFLYRVELSPAGSRLTGYELATRLSFLLRNTAPDASLLAAAERGDLNGDEGMKSAARGLLADPAAYEVVEQFHEELFGLSRYGSIQKDPSLFPTYQESVNDSLRRGELMFFRRTFESGGGVRTLFTSQTAFVDQATAGLYGLTAPGQDLTEVTLDEARPGFLTRAGFLAYNATLRDPDPIHRGVDIVRRTLCRKLEPPPGEIPPLPSFVPGQTNRERVTAHTGSGICAGCHGSVINPLGFAFEAFDALGQRRSTDNGKPVDTSGQFDFGDGAKPFADARELALLLGESQQAHGCYVASLAEFVLGRDLTNIDDEVVNELQSRSVTSNIAIKDALVDLVTSSSFAVAHGVAP